MKLNIYSIYDTAAAAYLRPFFIPSDGQASRAFTDIATDAEHEVGKHPSDYTLFKIGIWDDNTAEFITFSPEKVLTGMEAVGLSRQVKPGSLQKFDDEVKSNGANESIEE